MKNFYKVGDNVDVVESVLVHPTHTDGLAKSGDQAVVGSLVGVVNNDALATTDTCVLSTRGVYLLPVTGVDGSGNAAVAVGDQLYIDPAAAAAINKKATKTVFGIALEAVNSGATATIKVKLNGSN